MDTFDLTFYLWGDRPLSITASIICVWNRKRRHRQKPWNWDGKTLSLKTASIPGSVQEYWRTTTYIQAQSTLSALSEAEQTSNWVKRRDLLWFHKKNRHDPTKTDSTEWMTTRGRPVPLDGELHGWAGIRAYHKLHGFSDGILFWNQVNKSLISNLW